MPRPRGSEIPPLRIGDQEIAENLYPRQVLKFFCINEKALEFRHIRLRQNPHQVGTGAHQIIRQDGNAHAVFDREPHRRHRVETRRLSVDTPENRFVKMVLSNLFYFPTQ